jgi:hypothetical protein
MNDELPKPPIGPKVYGILSIVFASLTLLFTLLSGCAIIATQGGDQASWMYKGLPNAEARARISQRFAERTRPATVTQTAVYSLMSAALLFIGIGQLRYMRWARKLSIYWGGLALVCLVLTIALSLLITGPANREMFAELQSISEGMDAAINKMAGSWASSSWMLLGQVIFYAPYPILLIVYFSRTRAREAMGRS